MLPHILQFKLPLDAFSSAPKSSLSSNIAMIIYYLFSTTPEQHLKKVTMNIAIYTYTDGINRTMLFNCGKNV